MPDTSPHKPIRKAIFPVAGLGTRCLPGTKVMPKEMLIVNDKPLIQHVVEEAREAGIEEFIFVTSPSKKMLEDHFARNMELEQVLAARGKHDMLEKIGGMELNGHLHSVFQDKPLGLGHAVWCAEKLVGGEPFAVILPDVLVQNDVGCLKQMMDVYAKHGGNIIAVENVKREDTSKYGIVDTGGANGKIQPVRGLVEKPKPEDAPSTLSIIGRYILQPEVFKHLAAFETGAGGEIQLTDAMAKLIGVQDFHALRFEGKTHDCGGSLGFIEANIAYALKDPQLQKDVQDIVKKYAAL
jgi:UTP--glucose-1-phosphate uridylyltransferase